MLSAASLLCFIIVCGLLLKLHILRTRARAGDEEAASALVLPSYRYIIFAFAGTYLVDGLYDFLWGSRDDCLVPRRLVLCLSLALRRGCIDGTALFFTFHGAGRRSIRTTLCITIPWALVVGGIEYLWDTDQCRDNHESINTDFRDVNILTLPAIAKALECMYIFILLVCYGALAVVPAYRLYRRPSLDFKFVWWQLLTIILLGVETFMDIMDYEHGHCLHWYYIVLLQCILGPFVFMATLRADSAYWQGLLAEKDFGGLFSPSSQNDSVASPRARASSASVRTSTFQRSMTITEPLLGQYLEKEAAEELAITMDLLSEAPNCEFIHFGLLSLEAKPINHDSADTAAQFDIIGVGGASKVYRGRYRDEPVAIKMIWCVDITTEIIQQFKQEVMILAQLAKHPNIIQVRGISVMPPALCVVMELCNRGSLFDVLHESVSSSAPPSPSQREEPTEGSPTPTSSPSPKVPLPWETRLRLACECAEALTFLHSREPPIVHKDIKSANFLIVEDEATHRLHVRLADLGSAIEVMQAELSTGSNSESSQEAPMAHQKPGLLFHSSSNNKLGSFADPDGERRRTSGSIISRNSSLKWNSFSSDEWAGSDAITPNWAAVCAWLLVPCVAGVLVLVRLGASGVHSLLVRVCVRAYPLFIFCASRRCSWKG